MNITSTPATGASIVFDGTRSRTIKAVRQIVLGGDEYRRTFTASDGNRYRVTSIMVYADGSSWAWAAQLTKKSQPYKNGMGLTMGGTERMAELYGADILDTVTDAIDLAEEREAHHAEALDEADARDRARMVELTLAENRMAGINAHRTPGPFSGPARGLPIGSVLAGRHLIGTASGLTMRETNTLVDALDVLQAHPDLARVLAGILLAE